MKKAVQNKLTVYNNSRRIERKKILEKGHIWTRPTVTMSTEKMYRRNKQKQETRRIILEEGA